MLNQGKAKIHHSEFIIHRFSNAQDFITQDCEGGIIVEPVSEIEKLIADS
jgi:hypothetical protein